MTFVFVLTLSQLFKTVSSLPALHAQNSGQYTAWHSEPKERGSFRLIVGCLITLSLCVWSAIHLNVPRRAETTGKRHWLWYALERAKWVSIGLLAPELVVYTAWRQWTSARLVAQKVNKSMVKASSSLSDTSSKQKWTVTHGFYAGMGGFVINTDSKNGKDYIPNNPRLTLTAEGVLFLVEKGFEIPWITEDSIKDRSKADGLAKTLVCLQAGYMIIQCLGRYLAELPISLLEINTLGHVVCALVMYLFWLNKPQDIHEPTEIAIPNRHDFAAFAWMCSNLSINCYGEAREISELCYYSGLQIDQLEPVSKIKPSGEKLYGADHIPLLGQLLDEDREHRDKPLPAHKPCPQTIEASISENQVLHGTKLGPMHAQIVSLPKKLTRAGVVTGTELWEPTTIFLDAIGVQRWQLASTFLDSVSHLSHPFDPEASSGMTWCFRDSSSRWRYLVVMAAPNWPTHAGLISSSEEIIWMVIALVTGIYGTLHGVMWNSHFPSSIEKTLWLVACINVGASGTLTSLGLLVDRMPYYLKLTEEKSAVQALWDLSERSWLAVVAMIFMVVICASLLIPGALAVLFYIPARLYLVTGAFLSLRSLPIEMYKTPDWTEWVPHL